MTEYTSGFERWWSSYPKHKRKGKGAAFKSWQKHRLEDRAVDLADIVSRQKAYDEHFRKYTPLPATYLNQGRYDDDVPTPPKFRPPDEDSGTDDQPPRLTRTQSSANGTLLKVLDRCGGVDERTLSLLVELKNALIEEHGQDQPTPEFRDDLFEQLLALAQNHDREANRIEMERARERYRRTMRI